MDNDKALIEDKLARALGLMKEALQLLDEAEALPDAGAHLDLAINVLQDWLLDMPLARRTRSA